MIEEHKYWYVIYTRSRFDKKVSLGLTNIGIENYCPQKKSLRKWKDRKKLVDTPLFNGYCFVNIEPSKYKEVFQVPGIVRYIYWCGELAKIREQDIFEIKRWLNDYDHDNIQTDFFSAEDDIIIQSGPFNDYEAKILNVNGKQLILVLKNLGLKLTTNLDQIIISKTT